MPGYGCAGAIFLRTTTQRGCRDCPRFRSPGFGQTRDQGHIPGALHIPDRELGERAPQELPDRDAYIVVYCWGPGCNGHQHGKWADSPSRR
ncbi:rhodanese-like domain-containing protein [Neomicrococcus aestuarii]|uniref:rhodanese-like domain-containing protein n=1 Tax=Neomicrococcus aestuarii TaxID=556325 RepID=UPI0009FCDB9A|nr:rhodanese-like domain-containing protein [Neomicrococcus aestuarii]